MIDTRVLISRVMNVGTLVIAYFAVTEGAPVTTNLTYAIMAISAIFGTLTIVGANIIVASGYRPSISILESNIVDGLGWLILAGAGWWWCLAAWTLQWFACAVVYAKVKERDAKLQLQPEGNT